MLEVQHILQVQGAEVEDEQHSVAARVSEWDGGGGLG